MSDLWDLEHYLTQHRKGIDHKNDYRSLELTQAFGRLLYDGLLCEEELRGFPGIRGAMSVIACLHQQSKFRTGATACEL
jgi:hypothetical protein